MPIIASEIIHIDVNKDQSIKIKFLDALSHRRCIHVPSYISDQPDMGMLYDFVAQLVGDKAIDCKNGTCCITENYFGFVDKLNNINK